MTPPLVDLHAGDCLEILDSLPPESFDAVVTDPPYHLTSIVRRFGAEGAAPAGPGTDGAFARASRGFMGQQWDGGDIAFRADTWVKVLRVLKPGGHLVAFNHSRTWARMAVAIEDAGFESRDSILSLYDTGADWAAFLESLSPAQVVGMSRALAAADAGLLAWIYGTGFPKSHDVAKGIDTLKGAVREKVRHAPRAEGVGSFAGSAETRPWIDAARARGFNEVDGPDPVTPEAAEWQGWGTALKPAFEPIVVARKPLAAGSVARQVLATGTGALNIGAARIPYATPAAPAAALKPGLKRGGGDQGVRRQVYGDFANAPQGVNPAARDGRWPANVVHDGSPAVLARFPCDPEGSVARFFYSAKATDADRRGSNHPTVKPQALMRWLVRLVCPRGGLVLDPFGGSGATGWAAHAEGRRCVLIERDPDFAAHIARGIAALAHPHRPPAAAATAQPDLFGVA